jgi:UDP-N-acetylmuramyl tripeptide synthase
MLITVGKLMGKKGSSKPGEIALKICPDVLRILSKKVKKEIVAVCGTNGKTTTNNIIEKILADKGNKVVCNKIGANMLPGIVTSFIEKAGLFGNLDADYATLEMDEASAVIIFGHLKPDIMIITNLFRDQLDRYGEIDMTANLLLNALKKAGDVKLLINGDDPVCAKIAKDFGSGKAYGINENLNINLDETKEGQFCAYCGNKLSYNFYHYSQLGDYKCSGCEFKRPEIDFNITNVDIKDGLKFKINDNEISVNYRGFYNVYNISGALAASLMLGISLDGINEILSDYKPQIARMEVFNLKKPVILNLAKNPAGFNQAIHTVLSDEKTKDIAIMINDKVNDGTDVSWIWDVDFEKLSDESVKSLGYLGMRRNDVEVRMKYAETGKPGKVYGSLRAAVEEMLESDGEVLYLLVNYSAIFEAQKLLKELEGNG